MYCTYGNKKIHHLYDVSLIKLLEFKFFNLVFFLNFSVGEWEIYLTENSSFIFYGMEKFIKYIPPEKLTALNIPGNIYNTIYIFIMSPISIQL